MNNNTVRLNKILRELNISTSYAAEILANKGQLIDPKPTTKLTAHQAALLRQEFQKQTVTQVETFDFEIGHHYDFEIKENRDAFSIVNRLGHPNETYTSDRIYLPPGSKVKLFVRKYKDNGDPILSYSVLSAYKLNKEYMFDVKLSPRGNGYLLEDNEYHEHYLPFVFQSLVNEGTITLKVIGYDEPNNKIIFDDAAIGPKTTKAAVDSSDLVNGREYKFEVLGFKEDYTGEENLVELKYKGKDYITKALGFQKRYGLPNWVYCTVNKEEHFRLYQNLSYSLEQAYQLHKPYTFNIIDEKVDDNETPYYVLKDHHGFTHRFYKNQIPVDTVPQVGTDIELFVVAINEKGGHLKLDWYQEDLGTERVFYGPDKVFKTLTKYSEDEHLYNLQEYIDSEQERTLETEFKPPYLDLFIQIENENNNWFFSYLSLLSQFNASLIKQEKFEQARAYIQLYIDLEEWLIESDFIEAYSKEKKQDIINNAEAESQKQKDLLQIIQELENKEHLKILEKIYGKLNKHGVISNGDLEKTMEYIKWDKNLLNTHSDLVYNMIRKLMDHNRLGSKEMAFFDRIVNQAYESTYATRSFVLTSGIQDLTEQDREELLVENKHSLVQIRLNQELGKVHYAVLKSAEVLRNLALLSKEVESKKFFLLASLDVLIKEISLGQLSMDKLVEESDWIKQVKELTKVENKCHPKLYYFKNSGVILNEGSSLLISNQLSRFSQDLELQEDTEILLDVSEGRIQLVATKSTVQNYKGIATHEQAFWGAYINDRKPFTQQFDNLQTQILSRRDQSIKNIIKSLDYIISIESEISKKIECLQTAKMITVILKDSKSYYYDELIKFYYRINGLVYNSESEFYSNPINEETLEAFPVLNKIQTIHALINQVGSKEIGELKEFMEDEDAALSSIAKMILAYNHVLHEHPAQETTLNELMKLIKLTILNKALFIKIPVENLEGRKVEETSYALEDLIINNGKEDAVTEFKTSIVFYPGSSEPNIEKQCSQIVKAITGFLNAKGGKLYVGIKDNGFLVGLASDYKQLEVNADGYERVLRKFIVKYTNTTVNGMLDFEFQKWASQEYLVIKIPASQNLIDFQGDFYQRQGTETRVIKGQDLTNLVKSRLQLETPPTQTVTSIQRQETVENSQFELDLTAQVSEVYKDDRISPETISTTKEGLYKVCIFEDRSWVWTDMHKDFDFGDTLDFSIADKDSYILICYSEGRLAKFRSRSFLSRHKNERQRNTFALRPDSEIVDIFEIKEDIDLLVKVSYAKETYLKIINSAEAGDVRNRLASQGTYFVQSNNDGIISIVPIDINTINSQQKERIRMTKQTLGVEITSDKIKELVEELKSKNLI